MHNSQGLEKVLSLRQEILAGDEKRLKEQRDAGKLTARERIAKIADAGSFVELFALVSRNDEGAGVVTGYATIEERPVYLFAQDFTVRGGAMGQLQAAKIVKLLELAQKTGAPVLALMDSAGVRIDEGAQALSAYSEIYQKMARMSGVCPMVALVLGPCIGGAALLSQLADVAEKVGQLMVFGPQVMDAMNGEQVDAEKFGGAKVAAEMGACALTAASEDEALLKARQVLALLPSSNLEDAEIVDADDLNRLLPAIDPADADALLNAVADQGTLLAVRGLRALREGGAGPSGRLQRGSGGREWQADRRCAAEGRPFRALHGLLWHPRGQPAEHLRRGSERREGAGLAVQGSEPAALRLCRSDRAQGGRRDRRRHRSGLRRHGRQGHGRCDLRVALCRDLRSDPRGRRGGALSGRSEG